MTSVEINRKKLFKFTAFCLGGSVAILALLYLAIWFINSHPGESTNVWIASVPIVSMLVLTVLAMRSLRGMDELEQKIHTDAMAFAFLMSFLIITSCGFFALAGFMKMTLDWMAPTMMICWVVGLIITLMRYR
ncbi:MAG TPA: hypothetical protein VH815_04610 [Acidobacteriota bacterium]|jgi:hypothetical protein